MLFCFRENETNKQVCSVWAFCFSKLIRNQQNYTSWRPTRDDGVMQVNREIQREKVPSLGRRLQDERKGLNEFGTSKLTSLSKRTNRFLEAVSMTPASSPTWRWSSLRPSQGSQSCRSCAGRHWHIQFATEHPIWYPADFETDMFSTQWGHRFIYRRWLSCVFP